LVNIFLKVGGQPRQVAQASRLCEDRGEQIESGGQCPPYINRRIQWGGLRARRDHGTASDGRPTKIGLLDKFLSLVPKGFLTRGHQVRAWATIGIPKRELGNDE
jgi:hypothetical protein